MSILFYAALLHKLLYIYHLHLLSEPTVISARLYHHHLQRSLHLVEVGAVSVKKKKTANNTFGAELHLYL